MASVENTVTTCSIDGCTFSRHSRGSRCYKHYKEHKRAYQKAWQAKRDAGKPRRIPRSERQCAVPGCLRPVHAVDWCHTHYKDYANRKPCSIEGCEKPFHAQGLCCKHYKAAMARGDIKVIQSQRVLSVEERFRGFVNTTDYCHLWSGHQAAGRGYFTGIGGRVTPAHRASYEMEFGSIPTDDEDKTLHIDHGCRVPLCVNSAHLEAVTHVENMRRREVASGRVSFDQRDGWLLFLAIPLWQHGADNMPSCVVRTA